jgi:ATP-dependent RNA helicase DeaD
MQLPSVEDVNVTRLNRFDDAITEALGDNERIRQFRDIVGHYISHHDVPEADVAAALAVVAQGGTPLLLSAEDERAARYEREEQTRKERAERGDRGGDRGSDRGGRNDRGGRSDRGDRGARPSRDDRYGRDERPPRDRFSRDERPARESSDSRGDRPERRPRDNSRVMASYRLEVGKRHKVEPRQIVGALANEGGLSREDFGAIQILPDHSIVQLPADLSRDVFSKLENTRISGKLIELRADHPGAGRRDEREERPERKPRHE